MKTLAFLFLASIIVLLAGLLLNEGHTSPRPPPSTERATLHGSANQEVPIRQIQAAPIKVMPPPTVHAEKIPISEVISAMENDNLCEVVSQLQKKSVFNVETASALVASLGSSPALLELYGAHGPFFGEAGKTSYKNKLSKFFLALRLAGLLHYSNVGSQDLPKAQEILLELEKEEPSNGAYPFVRLYVEKGMKYSTEKLTLAAAKAASASYFDTLLLNELQNVEGSRWQSASHNLVLTNFFDYANPINLSPVTQEFQDLDRKEKSRFSESLGLLMMQKARSANRGAFFLTYSPAEYEYGKTLAASDEPDSYSLSIQLDGQSIPYAPYLASPCDRSIYDTFFANLRSIL